MGFKDLGCSMAFLILGFFAALDQAKANVVVRKDNDSVVFKSTRASFTPRVLGSEICGVLFSGKPFDACSPLSSEETVSTDCSCSYFVLISRGNCSFDRKIRHAQDAGFVAVIVSDIYANSELVDMAGNSRGISIPAVFISKASGDAIFQFANDYNSECCILPSFETNVWLIMTICLISLLSIALVLALCFVIWQHRRGHTRRRRRGKSYVVSYRLVKAMPSVSYTRNCDGYGEAERCAICLDDYVDGAKLRILPCCHRFHSLCIDTWLTTWQVFCPICKQDARVTTVPISENTPLISDGLPYQASISFEDSTLAASQESVLGQHLDSTDSNSSSLMEHQKTHFCFSQLPLRFTTASIETPSPFLNRSLQFLHSQGSTAHCTHDALEAFRASPFFVRPSLASNSAPNILGSIMSPSMDS